MKVLKTIGKILLLLSALLVGIYLIINSDFIEERRLRDQVQKNLKVELTGIPKLIVRESYGFIEDGGDRALLSLNPTDCAAVSAVMTGFELSSEKSEYYEFFKQKNSFPKSLKTWRKSNSHGDFTSYALAEETCHLYRHYYYD